MKGLFSGHLILLLVIAVAMVFLLAALAPAMANSVRDALAKVTQALPNGAANVTSASIDTGVNAGVAQGQAQNIGTVEYLLTMPALTTGQLGDAATMKYDILVSANADLSSPTVLISSGSSNLTQTGAGGAGAAGGTYRFRLPSTAPRYVGFKATNSAAGNASGVSATLEALF